MIQIQIMICTLPIKVPILKLDTSAMYKCQTVTHLICSAFRKKIILHTALHLYFFYGQCSGYFLFFFFYQVKSFFISTQKCCCFNWCLRSDAEKWYYIEYVSFEVLNTCYIKYYLSSSSRGASTTSTPSSRCAALHQYCCCVGGSAAVGGTTSM